MKTFIFLALLFAPSLAQADDWEALAQPGSVAIMRHALAPGTGDPSEFRLGDCATQRNLSERGRDQARKIGDALRDRGVGFAQIFTSQWCRSKETADLLDLGEVVEAASLNSFFQDFSTRDRQTRDTLDLIEKTGGRLMLVTHQVNISAITGRSTRSGEILVLRVKDGAAEVTGSILIDP